MRKFKDFIKKNISVVLILAAVVVGILIGLLGKLLPSNTVAFLEENIITVFQGIFIKIIGYVAAPLIFVTIATSIYKMGSIKTFFGRGRRYLLSFIVIMLVCSTIVTFIALPVFGLNIETSNTSSSSFSEVVNILKNFLPKNLWDPFLNINLIQVDVLAMLTGITLLILNKEAEGAVKILDKFSKLLIKIMRYIAKIIPIYVVLAIVGMIWNNEAGSLGGIYKVIILFAVISIVINGVFLFKSYEILSKSTYNGSSSKRTLPVVLS